MNPLLPQNEFLSKYRIEPNTFEATGLEWSELEAIYDDYLREAPRLEAYASHILNDLMKSPNVHSVRYRIKHPEHVIGKVIRKRLEYPNRVIDRHNYKTLLNDLIGLRALHLFKEQWLPIHEHITNGWDLKKKPIAYYREGDATDYQKSFQEVGCVSAEHPYGYRSVHYVLRFRAGEEVYLAEVQVRTIFEEAWSEVDHTIRYPYHQDNHLIERFLLILNRLAGSADEMGTFLLFLKADLQQREELYRQTLQSVRDKERQLDELEQQVRELAVPAAEKEALLAGLAQIRTTAADHEVPPPPDLSWINQLSALPPDFQDYFTQVPRASSTAIPRGFQFDQQGNLIQVPFAPGPKP
jgi:putative GTP pyrophosphokinase